MKIYPLLKMIESSGGSISVVGDMINLNILKGILNQDEICFLKSEKISLIKLIELKSLIKDISNYYGGDNPTWLNEYTDEILCNQSNDLDTALACFRNLRERSHIKCNKYFLKVKEH